MSNIFNSGEQCQTVIFNLFVIIHNHYIVKEFVNGCNQLASGLENCCIVELNSCQQHFVVELGNCFVEFAFCRILEEVGVDSSFLFNFLAQVSNAGSSLDESRSFFSCYESVESLSTSSKVSDVVVGSSARTASTTS